jgi:uncharacterized membrane protein (UPF0127 family)
MRKLILKIFAPLYRIIRRFFPGTQACLELSDGRKIKVSIASDRFGRALGLSHLSSFPEHPLLFIFNVPGRHSFHMKDMHFPLDIVFINDAGQVVFVAYNQVPDDEVFARPMIVPPMPAKYVLEIPAMSAHEYALNVGSIIKVSGN